MQNTGHFHHFYIASIEVSSKYVILKFRYIKALCHTRLMLANA